MSTMPLIHKSCYQIVTTLRFYLYADNDITNLTSKN